MSIFKIISFPSLLSFFFPFSSLQLDMPIKLESQDDVERFAIGDLPRGAGESYSNVSVLGIFDMASEKGW